MKEPALRKHFRSITAAYFVMAGILSVAELFALRSVIFIFKPFLIPVMALLYISRSDRKNSYYIWSLLFAWLSNLFLLSAAKEYILYGIIAFMIYRFLSIVVIFKKIKNFLFLPFIVAALPFLFIFSCLINITVAVRSPEFYPTVLNGVLITIMSGVSLSNYVLDDNKMNSWLAISTLLFVALVCLFLIERYYISNIVFQPIAAIIFAFGHYAFYKFLLEAEKSDQAI